MSAKQVFRSMAVRGLSEKNLVLAMSGVPSSKVKRWLKEFLAPRRVSLLPKEHRLVNHFKIGADPEFALFDGSREGPQELNTEWSALHRPINVAEWGYKPDTAWGADMGGRVMEIRAAPSRSILEVVTSIWSSLAWFYRTELRSRQVIWKAGAVAGRDGMGGHIHFGRLRGRRACEVAALDMTTAIFRAIGTFDDREFQHRRAQSGYGMPGDTRNQPHGYEYRTFPSWLDTPKAAFVTMTFSKLLVHNPDLLIQIDTDLGAGRIRASEILVRILAYYKGLDDDARLAHALLTDSKTLEYQKADFKRSWGLADNRELSHLTVINRIPPVVVPTRSEVLTMFRYLTGQKALEVNWNLSPSWRDVAMPVGYADVQVMPTRALFLRGMSEITKDLVVSHLIPVRLVVNNQDQDLLVSKMLAQRLPVNWKESIRGARLAQNARVLSQDDEGMLCEGVLPSEEGMSTYMLALPDTMRIPETLERTKRLICGGVFPIWDRAQVSEASFGAWQEAVALTKGKDYGFKTLFTSTRRNRN